MLSHVRRVTQLLSSSRDPVKKLENICRREGPSLASHGLGTDPLSSSSCSRAALIAASPTQVSCRTTFHLSKSSSSPSACSRSQLIRIHGSCSRVASVFTAHTSAKETVCRRDEDVESRSAAGKWKTENAYLWTKRRNERENDLMEKTNAWNHV